MAFTRRGFGAALLASAAATRLSAQTEAPIVAAASDLRFALDEVAAAYLVDTGQEVRLTFGSTGNFATQIRQGAPFQLFMAADEAFVLALHDEGLTRDAGTLYAEGRIVVVAPKGSPLVPDTELDNLAALLDAGELERFAIASPEHAPYGMRAAEALRHRGLWDRLQPHLVLGENVAQAAQFALSGNAEGGVVAHALALAPEIASQADFALIPADWHTPLRQRMALLNGAGPEAEAFFGYVQSPPARAILERYGFVLPD